MSSQVQLLGKQTMRAVKNYTKGYTDTQTMVREATSSDPWGPSGTQMNEIAQLTYNEQDFIEVMEMLDKRLNDKGKNWRHVFKSLTLLDYLLHAGSENVVKYFKENLYVVKTLREFVYVDDETKDQGANVRQKAKDITALLMDDERLKAERKGRASMRDRMGGGSGAYSPPPMPPPTSTSSRPRSRTTGSRPNRNEDDDLRRAIEESKRMAESEAGKHKDEDDMARAIKMSQDEDERRKAELARNPNSGLFDEQQRDPNQLIDLDSSVQPQPTGMVPQFTGMPSQQFSSYNPFAAQQQAAQEEYMRMLDMQQQQQQQEQQQQYQQMLQQQQQQQMFQQQQFLMSQPTAQPLVPQPTAFGSNNPFAAFSQPSLSASATPVQQQPSPQPQPSLPRPASQPNINSAQPNINSSQPFPKRNNEHDEKHKELAAMLGSGGSGIDTYGNVGNMRIPMGSAFHPSNAMQPQPTGATNPFQRTQSQPQPQQQPDQPFFQL